NALYNIHISLACQILLWHWVVLVTLPCPCANMCLESLALFSSHSLDVFTFFLCFVHVLFVFILWSIALASSVTFRTFALCSSAVLRCLGCTEQMISLVGLFMLLILLF